MSSNTNDWRVAQQCIMPDGDVDHSNAYAETRTMAQHLLWQWTQGPSWIASKHRHLGHIERRVNGEWLEFKPSPLSFHQPQDRAFTVRFDVDRSRTSEVEHWVRNVKYVLYAADEVTAAFLAGWLAGGVQRPIENVRVEEIV